MEEDGNHILGIGTLKLELISLEKSILSLYVQIQNLSVRNQYHLIWNQLIMQLILNQMQIPRGGEIRNSLVTTYLTIEDES